jgi:hypothetical protein
MLTQVSFCETGVAHIQLPHCTAITKVDDANEIAHNIFMVDRLLPRNDQASGGCGVDSQVSHCTGH